MPSILSPTHFSGSHAMMALLIGLILVFGKTDKSV